MKKFFLLFILLVANVVTFAQVKYDRHWSVTAEMGANKFDGDVYQKYNDVVPNSILKLSMGVSVERTLTPVWGLGAELYYFPYSAKNGDIHFSGNLFHFNPYVAMNLLNLFDCPSEHWGVWGTLGGGLAYYNTTLYKDDVKFDKVKDGWALTVPVGLMVEYNLTKSLAVGAKLQYRSHNKDNLEGSNKTEDNGGYNFKGVTNDFLSMGMFLVRWKIGGKNNDHVRNGMHMAFDAYAMAKEAKAKADSLPDKINNIKKKVDGLEPRVDELERTIADGPDNDGDGVPNYRDKEPNTPKGNIVDFYGRTIPGFDPKGKNGEPINPNDIKYFTSDGPDGDNDGVPDNRDKEPNTPKNTPVDFWGRSLSKDKANGFGSVYFDFDKTNLDQEAERTIKLAAQKLTDNPMLMVEVRGYCDYMGSVEYNQGLSNRRAEKVKAELVNMYGISPSRIITNGKGKILEPKTAYRLNRRCNFFFSE